MKGKYRALIKDVLLFTLSTFLPKAISFFLVPLYTNCLTTAEYGVADLVSTTVSLIIPFLTLDINDAVMRFTIESKQDIRPFKFAFVSVLKGILIVITAVAINDIFHLINVDKYIELFFVLNYSFISLYGICIAYLRATDKVGVLSFVGIMITVVSICSNILCLLVLKLGLIGYMISGSVGYIIADILILIYIRADRILRTPAPIDNELKRQMLAYSVPLIAANISWWINSSSDRYIVTALRGVDENGVYSVAYKIPTILQMLQSVFSQAWLLSVFREYKSENGAAYVGKIYELYYIAMSLACSALIVLDIPLARFLYAKEFFSAWRFVPYLLISVVFIANAGFFESMLTLQKKSKVVATTTIIGAIVNIVLNFILIYFIGAMGAAIATACGYLVMWVTRIGVVMQGYTFKVKWLKQAMMYVLLIIEGTVMVIFHNYAICIGILVIISLLNAKEIIQIAKMVCNKIKNLTGVKV